MTPDNSWDGVERRLDNDPAYAGPERRIGLYARVEGVRDKGKLITD